MFLAIFADCVHVLSDNVLVHGASQNGPHTALAGMVFDSLYNDIGIWEGARNRFLRAGGHYVSKVIRKLNLCQCVCMCVCLCAWVCLIAFNLMIINESCAYFMPLCILITCHRLLLLLSIYIRCVCVRLPSEFIHTWFTAFDFCGALH